MTDAPDADDPALELQRTFGRNFRAKRQAAGLTQERAASLAGMHRPDLGAIERGVGNVTLKTMQRLAAVVDCRVEVLLVPLRAD